MKSYGFEQGSPEWHKIRAGCITATGITSLFAKPRKGTEGVFGKGAKAYIEKKAVERINKYVMPIESNDAMEHGKTYEPIARKKFEKEFNKSVEEIGFVERSYGIGCSPDGLIGDDELLEIKCPYSINSYKKFVDKNEASRDYMFQMLHQLWVTERSVCHFFAYWSETDEYFYKAYSVDKLVELLKLDSFDAYKERILLVKEIIDLCETSYVSVLSSEATSNIVEKVSEVSSVLDSTIIVRLEDF